MRRLLVLHAAVLAAAALTGSASANPVVDRAVAELRADPVYVDPAATTLAPGDEPTLRARIEQDGAAPLTVAVLPASAGDPTAVARRLERAVGRRSVYAVIVGRSFRGGSTDPRVRTPVARTLADRALQEGRSGGALGVLELFADRVGDYRRGGSAGSDGSGGGGSGGWILAVLVAAGAAFLGWRRLGARRKRDLAFAEVKAAARDDLAALADDVQGLDLEVERPGTDPRAKEHYLHAMELYQRADDAFERARRAADLGPVTSALEQARFEMETAKARLEGRRPPERRPPCFFDPRHGSSVADRIWQPPYGDAKPVPVCAADAARLDRGEEPASREVLVGGRRTPYWNAPAYYGPWAGGFFGGYGGLLPGLLIGSLLGSAMSPGVADAGVFGGGDLGGGDADFGGGDFGGGDFGGGDFGGGDF